MIESGIDYERFCADELRKYGFKNIHLTKATGDFGVDIVCEKRGEKWAVQCKYYSSNVGVSAVQQAAAGKAMYQCDRAMVMTNSSFTSQAKELANQNGVELLEKIEPQKNTLKIIGAVLLFTYILAACAIVLSEAFSGGKPIKAALIALIPAADVAVFRLFIGKK